MVSIGDIQSRHFSEQGDELRHHPFIIYDPEHMAYTVICRDIINRLMIVGKISDHAPYLTIVPVSEKHRLGIRIAYIEVIDSVLLLLKPCEFMLIFMVLF